VSDASCPHCGEPVERRQLVCLNCGGRVALKERTPLAREPVTAVAAVLLAVIVIGSGLFGFAISELTSGDGEPSGADGSAGTPAAGTGERQRERGSTETTPAEPEALPPEEPAPGEAAVPGWPKGLRAHTVVLVTSSDRAAALNVAREARGAGLVAGMVRSDAYDLGSGLWIVYSGHFTTREGAQRQAAELADRYPGAYAQLVQSPQ
jgi:DNA-directed RNA polymerase subunit RPC12/RpoP